MKNHLVFVLVIGALAVTPGFATEADPAAGGYHHEELLLSEAELDEIYNQVLAQHAVLSSSPGIKFASADRSRRKNDRANVLYYPHVEEAGVKEAFHVQCTRVVPETAWNCESPGIRRYVTLEGQDFEVRLTDGITFDPAMAMIEATRNALPDRLDDGSPAPRTAILIKAYEGAYMVFWGSPEGYMKLTMQAHLIDGADPADPGSWQANVYRYPD